MRLGPDQALWMHLGRPLLSAGLGAHFALASVGCGAMPGASSVRPAPSAAAPSIERLRFVPGPPLTDLSALPPRAFVSLHRREPHGDARPWCSTSRIGPGLFLTAAHCISRSSGLVLGLSTGELGDRADLASDRARCVFGGCDDVEPHAIPPPDDVAVFREEDAPNEPVLSAGRFDGSVFPSLVLAGFQGKVAPASLRPVCRATREVETGFNAGAGADQAVPGDSGGPLIALVRESDGNIRPVVIGVVARLDAEEASSNEQPWLFGLLPRSLPVPGGADLPLARLDDRTSFAKVPGCP